MNVSVMGTMSKAAGLRDGPELRRKYDGVIRWPLSPFDHWDDHGGVPRS
jgi:hypothetical protein